MTIVEQRVVLQLTSCISQRYSYFKCSKGIINPERIGSRFQVPGSGFKVHGLPLSETACYIDRDLECPTSPIGCKGPLAFFSPKAMALIGFKICGHRARSRLASQTGASEAGGSAKICVPNDVCRLMGVIGGEPAKPAHRRRQRRHKVNLTDNQSGDWVYLSIV